MTATAEQEEKLSMLIAFAGDTVDADLAKVMLESAGWDVERALNGLLEDAAPGTGHQAPAPTAAPADSSRVGMIEEQAEELSTEDLRALLEAYDVDHSMCLEKTDLVNLLEKTVGSAGGTQTEPQPPFPMEADMKLVNDLFSQPSTRASSRGSEPVCVTCDLGHPLVQHTKTGHACDVGGPNCRRVGTSFRCGSGCDFDACNTCCPLDDFPENWAHRLKVICEKFPSAGKAQVVALLKKHSGAACVVEHELTEIIRVKEEQARQNAERKMEIDMQNEEYHESLLMDQHRQIQRKEEEEVDRKQAEELKRKQAEEAEANREAGVALEAKRARVDQPEPDKAHPDRCQIVIRTPSGKRLNRTFLGSDEVSFIFDWIDIACAEEEFVNDSYQVVARLPGKPNKVLCKSQRSLKDEGVEHQSVFMISSS